MHMATLIHKMNLLLLEVDSVTHLKNSLSLIYSPKLLVTVVDFVTNTDSFANLGLRFLEIICLSYAAEVAKTEIVGVLSGLLRTNDYETVAQSFSFLSTLLESAAIKRDQEMTDAILKDKQEQTGSKKKRKFSVEAILTKRIVSLIMKTLVKTPEIEFIHYGLQILSHALADKDLRQTIFEEDLKKPNAETGEAEKLTYSVFLKNTVEKMPEIVSIQKLHKKVERQRKEIECWQKAATNK